MNRIFIFNSNDVLLRMLRLTFEDEGYSVDVFNVTELPKTGSAEFLSQGEPDLIIFDISYPYQEHWDLFTAFRRVIPGVPVILTSTADDGLKQIDDAAAWEGKIFVKPYAPQDLIDAVREELAGSRPVAD